MLRSRNVQAEKAARLAAENQSLKTENANLRALVKRVQERLDESQQTLQKPLEEDQRLRLQPIELPSDLPLPHHTYGPKMIAAADDWIWFADHSNQ